MTSTREELQLLLAEIEAGPEGPEIGAFFDFDGTLIAGYSAEAFVLDAIRRRKVDPQTMVRSLLAGLDMQLRGSDVTALMEIAAEAGKGRREEALIELGPAPLPGAGGRHRLPRGPGDREGPSAEGPHRGAGLVGDAVPGRAPGRRPRHRARAVHEDRGGGRAPHRPARRPGPVGPEQGRRRGRLRGGLAASSWPRATATPMATRTSSSSRPSADPGR